jgi:hypothetical protein
MDDDDVIDFMIMEAVAVAASQQEREAEQSSERKEWRRDREGLDKLKSAAAAAAK